MTRLLAFFNPISWLLSTSEFMTRSHCGPGWTEPLKAIYISSNLAISVSYFAIPAMLLVLYRSKRQELPSPWMLALFAGFILLCGLTHLSDVAVFWWAPYRLYTAIFAAAGLTSLTAAATLPWVIRPIVKLPGREYVHAINNQLQAKYHEADLLRLAAMERERQTAEANRLLKDELARLQDRLRDRLWYTERTAILSDIERITALIPQPETTGGIGNGP